VAIGPAGDAVLDEVKIGPSPRVARYSPHTFCCHSGAGILATDGSVWAVSTGDDKLVEIDPVTYEVVSRTSIPRSPQDITAAAGSLWVSVR
jgi:streptogramin lyase